MKNPQRVVCAAIRNSSGSVITGARHFDKVMCNQISKSQEDWNTNPPEQGFIDQFGEFITRSEAYKIADTNSQIINNISTSTKHLLFSEHLY